MVERGGRGGSGRVGAVGATRNCSSCSQGDHQGWAKKLLQQLLQLEPQACMGQGPAPSACVQTDKSQGLQQKASIAKLGAP